MKTRSQPLDAVTATAPGLWAIANKLHWGSRRDVLFGETLYPPCNAAAKAAAEKAREEM
jgi:hypothetical protein